MDWLEKVLAIKEKLTESGYHKSVEDITNAQMVFGTFGEMYLEVMNVLLNIHRNNLPESNLIEKDTFELINYGKKIGYFIIDNPFSSKKK